MTNKEKKLVDLSKKLLTAATEPSVETTQLKATKIHLIASINHNDPNTFCQQVHSKALDMQSRGSDEVEIQYSTTDVAVSTVGAMVMHSALLIGRKYADTKIR